MKITAVEITEAGFALFGRCLRMAPSLDKEPGAPDLVHSTGDTYEDCRTRAPLLSSNGSLGITRGSAAPCATARMERHLHTEEAIFCLREPVVLVVAPPSEAPAPAAADLRAFIITPGTVAVMMKGTWHDAGHGLRQPVEYYWLATCRDDIPSDWIEVSGGPVEIALGS